MNLSQMPRKTLLRTASTGRLWHEPAHRFGDATPWFARAFLVNEAWEVRSHRTIWEDAKGRRVQPLYRRASRTSVRAISLGSIAPTAVTLPC